MFHLRCILNFFLLVFLPVSAVILSHSALAENGSRAADTQPVWVEMESARPASDKEPAGSFVPPPPQAAEKLTATIIATNSRVPQGESITFTLESNASDVRYYWVSGAAKGNKKSFVVDTHPLEIGKHRVRATVTNSQREQAHAAYYFFVTQPGSVVSDDNSVKPDDNTAIELPAASASVETTDETAPTPEEPAADISDTTAATPGGSDNSNETLQNGSTADTDQAMELPAATTLDHSGSEEKKQADSTQLRIIPKQLSVIPGEDATFTTNLAETEKYHFQWKFTDKRGVDDRFTVSSSHLEAGDYAVHLSVTGEDNTIRKAQAILRIAPKNPALVAVPKLLKLDIEAAKRVLKQHKLVLGEVVEREEPHGHGEIIEQHPGEGENTGQGSAVDIVISLPTATVKAPDLLGRRLAEAKQQLLSSGLEPGQITYQVDEHAIHRIIGQSKVAGTPVTRGERLDLVVGKAAPKPLNISIHPVSSVVESGTVAEFNAIIVDPELDDNLDFSWKLGDLSGKGKVFRVDTSQLSLGEYTLEVMVKDSRGREANNAATLKITAKTSTIPDVSGKSLAEAKAALEQAGFSVNVAARKSGDVTREQILEQSPRAGKQAAVGSVIQLTLETPRPLEEPSIELSVDSKAIKLGESVTFQTRLIPPPDDHEIHYVYSINAQKKANVQPTLEWTPEKEGIYSIAVTAFGQSGVLAKSSTVTVTVAPKWEMPIARIVPEMQVIHQGDNAEFISTSTYDLNSTLQYKWSSETAHGGSKKQFVFATGDIAPGSYTIKLTVTDDKGNQSVATSMLVVQAEVAGSFEADNNGNGAGKGGQVPHPVSNPSVSPAGSTDPEIRLSASRQLVRTHTPLKIKALSSVSLTGAYYYFEPGDEKNTQWLSTSEIEHSYTDFGTYLVRAAVKQGDKIYYSDSVTIWVWSPLLLFFTAGIGLLAYLLMWWWTKRIPQPDKPIDTPPAHKPAVVEEQIPLQADEQDIVTELRPARDAEKSVLSVLKRALIQFVLGIIISVVVIYVILKSASLL